MEKHKSFYYDLVITRRPYINIKQQQIGNDVEKKYYSKK